MNKIIKDTLILLVITLISGTALGFVYNFTKEARAMQEEKVKNEAYKTVFKEASSFGAAISVDDDALSKYILDRDVKTKSEDSSYENDTINAQINEIVEALDKDGNVLGYVITVTDNEAYDGAIKFSVGITKEGIVNGISYLSISETPGLGMKATEDSFIENFSNKDVDYFKYTKSGAVADNEVDALSGATITTNAVTNGVTAAIYCFDFITGGDGNE